GSSRLDAAPPPLWVARSIPVSPAHQAAPVGLRGHCRRHPERGTGRNRQQIGSASFTPGRHRPHARRPTHVVALVSAHMIRVDACLADESYSVRRVSWWGLCYAHGACSMAAQGAAPAGSELNDEKIKV